MHEKISGIKKSLNFCSTKYRKANSQQAVAELNVRQKAFNTEVY
jgi:hypothetical protein